MGKSFLISDLQVRPKLLCQGGSSKLIQVPFLTVGEEEDRGRTSLHRAGLGEVEDRGRQRSLHRARGRFEHDSYTSQRLGEVEGSRRLAEIPTASMGRAGFNNYNRGDFGQGESPLWARRNLNREGQCNNNRVSYS